VSELQWNSEFDPETTDHELNQVEETLKVKIPLSLRELWTSFSCDPPQRDGEDASYVVWVNQEKGALELAIFQGFCAPEINHPTLDWLADKYRIKPKTVLAFGLNGASPMFLNYDNDPTRSNPEIWDSYMEGFTLDESWRIIAPDFDTFLARLKTEKEAKQLGIEL